MQNELFTVVSRFGDSAQLNDVEAVLDTAGFARWPLSGAYTLAQVVYYTTRAAAEEIAGKLGPHREGAIVSTLAHDAQAPYITQHGSPIRGPQEVVRNA